jgi:DNA-binding CsgD family transcriptional regulator
VTGEAQSAADPACSHEDLSADLGVLSRIYGAISSPVRRRAAAEALARHLGLDPIPFRENESLEAFAKALQQAANAQPATRGHVQTSSFLRERIEEIVPVCVQLGLALAHRDLALLAMDRVHRAVIAVTHPGGVMFLNEAARAILAKNDGLRIENNHLAAARSSDTIELRELIRRSASGAHPANALCSISLTRPSLAPAFVLQITASRSGGNALDKDPTGQALVFVTDPEAEVGIHDDLLCRIYGLTKAEARLAAEIVAGKSPEEAADKLCVSIKTVRTHLHRIFMKTGTTRQSQLVAQLLRTIL